jgi:hypothetical protein
MIYQPFDGICADEVEVKVDHGTLDLLLARDRFSSLASRRRRLSDTKGLAPSEPSVAVCSAPMFSRCNPSEYSAHRL